VIDDDDVGMKLLEEAHGFIGVGRATKNDLLAAGRPVLEGTYD
jgi:hypothetical protein